MKNTNKQTKKSFFKGASFTVALMMVATLLAKGLGLLRQILMANYYGAGMLSDAFTEALHIPLTFFDLLFATAISGCFIPVYNSFKRRDDGEISEEADDFACSFFNFILLGSSILAVIGIIIAGPITMTLHFDAETKRLTAQLMRIMFPIAIFSGTAYTITGIMQSRGKYLLPAMISALSNAAVIIYFLFIDGFLEEKFGDGRVYGLAVAYLVGWSLQLLTMLIPLLRGGFKYKPVLRLKTPQMKNALKLAPSIMVGSWLIPALLLSAMFFASRVDESGSVAMYEYANTAFITIAGTLTYSICNYAFPQLSRLAASGDNDSFNSNVRTGVLSVLALILPFMSAVIFLSREIIAALYLRGEFGATEVAGSAGVLRILIMAMPAFAVIELGCRVFYSKNLGKIPMIASICGIAVDVLIAALFTATGVIDSLGIKAVAIATVIGYFTSCIVMIAGAAIKLRGLFNRRFAIQLIKVVVCTAVCMLVLFGALQLISHILGGIDIYGGGAIYNIAVSAAAFVPSVIVYILLLKLLRVDFKIGAEPSSEVAQTSN